jgi:WD40 repeat protein
MTDEPVLITGGYDHSIKYWKSDRDLHSFHTIQHSDKYIVNRMELSRHKKWLGCACSFLVKVYDINHSRTGVPVSILKS